MAKSVLSPIDAFVSFFKDVKPYHTKLLEIVQRYNFNETIDVLTSESLFRNITFANTPLCKPAGFGVDFDDECGFDNDECCDLFQCLGGYGVIYDNSDLLISAPLQSVNAVNDTITLSGDYTYDTKINIKSVPDNKTIVVTGDLQSLFQINNLFLIVPAQVFPIVTTSANQITISGNHVVNITAQGRIRLYGAAENTGKYDVVVASYLSATNQTVVEIPSVSAGTIWQDGNIWRQWTGTTWSVFTPLTSKSIPVGPTDALRWFNPDSGMLAVWVASTSLWQELAYTQHPIKQLVPNLHVGYLQVGYGTKDAGAYTIDSVAYDGIQTVITINEQFPFTDATESQYGAIQLRTGLFSSRWIDIENNDFHNNGEHKILYSTYDRTTDTTTLQISGKLTTTTAANGGTVNLYGYMFGGGFDENEECADPKPMNVAVEMSESLVFNIFKFLITPTVTPTMTVTPSITQSIYPTPSVTRTNTITPTPSVTVTFTPSVTPGLSPTVSPTVSITPTPSTTPGASTTPTLTTTPTVTVTPSVTVTASVTPSVTLTRTPTLTPTLTPSNTVTQTPTLSPTPSVTPTNTSTVTPTMTITPSVTRTATVTPTAGSTPTPSVTQTASVTPSTTLTRTPTQTPTFTPTNTITPTVTASPTVTQTASVTPTITLSATPTVTITPSITQSATPSPTASATQTPTITPTPSTTASVSITPSISVTPSITGTCTPTPTPTSSVTLTATPTVTVTSSQTPSVTPSITGTATLTPTPTATLTPSNTVTPTITPSQTSSVTMTPTPTITATASVTPSVTPTVTRTVTPTISLTPSPSVSAPSSPTPTPTISTTRTPTPAPSTTPTQSVSATPAPSPSAPASPTPTVTPSSRSVFIMTAGSFNAPTGVGYLGPGVGQAGSMSPATFNGFTIGEFAASNFDGTGNNFTLAFYLTTSTILPQNFFNNLQFVDQHGTLYTFTSASANFHTNNGGQTQWVWTRAALVPFAIGNSYTIYFTL